MDFSIEKYYPFKSTGKISYDPKRGKIQDPNWAILSCDESIIDYYKWHLLRWGCPIMRGSLWGSHISFVKGEKIPNKKFWKKYDGNIIEFRYSNIVRYENDIHAWIDVYCPELHQIREELGLKKLPMSFHLTLGRLVHSDVKYISRYRPYLKK